jgi:hypothetical protein
MTRGNRSLILLILVILAGIIVPFVIWGAWFDATLSLEGARKWMESYGAWAWAAGMAALVADIVLPVPSTVVMSALGWMYGWWIGGLICAAGSMLSGIIAYAACRWLGRGAARWILRVRMVCAKARRFSRSAAAGWWRCHAGCRCCRRRWPVLRAFHACAACVFASAGLRVGAHRICVRSDRSSRSKRTGLGDCAELCRAGVALAGRGTCAAALTHLLSNRPASRQRVRMRASHDECEPQPTGTQHGVSVIQDADQRASVCRGHHQTGDDEPEQKVPSHSCGGCAGCNRTRVRQRFSP